MDSCYVILVSPFSSNIDGGMPSSSYPGASFIRNCFGLSVALNCFDNVSLTPPTSTLICIQAGIVIVGFEQFINASRSPFFTTEQGNQLLQNRCHSNNDACYVFMKNGWQDSKQLYSQLQQKHPNRILAGHFHLGCPGIILRIHDRCPFADA